MGESGKMRKWLAKLAAALGSGVLPLVVLCLVALAAQAQQATLTGKAPAIQAEPVSEESLDATREQLFRVMRLSPKSATVIVRDPSLLADEPYVGRNNPALAKFLQDHPEVVRNPEFYLFANSRSGFPREFRLERDLQAPASGIAPAVVVPFLVFLCILLALLWLIRVLLENRRWTRIFNQQSEAHNKLLEKFGASEELLNYMRTDSGKRALEISPPSLRLNGLQWNSPIARILTPLQFGVVFALVGAGFLYLMNAAATNQGLDLGRPGGFLVFGIVALTLGLGLIASAALSWVFARHLGLMPQKPGAEHQAEAN